MARREGMYFGFGALLNGPHDQVAHEGCFAACHGVPTSHAKLLLVRAQPFGQIAPLLQAKYLPAPKR